jgi:hypothetical protein
MKAQKGAFPVFIPRHKAKTWFLDSPPFGRGWGCKAASREPIRCERPKISKSKAIST